jgi:tetratricopeptide (TPR) repeat protein
LRGALLVAAIALVYANSLSGPFVLDDNDSILANRTLHDWTNLAALIDQPRNTPLSGRPVVAFTFAINYAVGGLAVAPFHIVNIAIHALCALLLFGIVRRTLALPQFAQSWRNDRESTNVAFAVALIWAVHPLNTEVMDYLTQRTESLMALFLLASLYAAIRGVTCRRKVFWQIVSVAACGLGMLCKESMVVTPVLIVLYDRIFLFASFSESFSRRWRLYGCLALTWLGLLYMMVPGPRAGSAGFATGANPWNYLLNQAVMIARYLRLSVWPRGLVVNYGPPVPLRLLDVLPQAGVVMALIVATAVAFRRQPAAAFLGAWFFITLAPTSSFIPISTEVGAERRMYLPLMAIACLLVVAGSSLLRRRDSLPGPAIITVVAMALGIATIARNREYASQLSLAESTLRHWPTDVAHGMVGNALSLLHRDDEALRELRLAARTDARARYNLGVGLYNVKRLDEAIVELERFAAENPMNELAPTARRALGDAFAIQHRWTQAINEYRLALSMIPNDPDTRRKLVHSFDSRGIELVETGRFAEAVDMFRKAAAEDPSDWSVRHNLAAALLDNRDAAGAEIEARKATEANPGDAGSFDLLGRALAIQGRYDEATNALNRALQIAPGDEQIQDDLRRVLAARKALPRQ